jgi:hypothetical protein
MLQWPTRIPGKARATRVGKHNKLSILGRTGPDCRFQDGTVTPATEQRGFFGHEKMKRVGEEIDHGSVKKQDASEAGRPSSPDMPLDGSGGWEQHVSSKTGKTYWFNPITGQTQWTSPNMVFLPRSPPPEASKLEAQVRNLNMLKTIFIEPTLDTGFVQQQDLLKPQLTSIDGTKINIDIITANNYPKRPGQQRCTYYLTHGICKFGESCKFDHPADR